MGFRKLRGVPVSYKQQGDIYFCCLNYDSKSRRVQMKIESLCASAAGAHCDALFELVTTGKSIPFLADKHHMSIETLQRCRKRFYMLWQSAEHDLL